MRTITCVEESVRQWWNGIWGRLARRDVWLVRQTRWKVIARAGDTETGKVLEWEFDTEGQAIHLVNRLLHADAAGQWREQEAGAAPPGGSANASRASVRPKR
nr:hypothetical protein [Salinispora arenicola]